MATSPTNARQPCSGFGRWKCMDVPPAGDIYGHSRAMTNVRFGSIADTSRENTARSLELFGAKALSYTHLFGLSCATYLNQRECLMATKLKVIEEVADIVPAPQVPEFDIAPTRKRHAGWTDERQRKFIERVALTGCVGDACALVGVASSSAYRLRNKAGAESFARAWDAALRQCATRLVAIGLDRAIHGRVERHYQNGELV